MNGRVLAIDPGDKHLGIAISDPTGMIANPCMLINHVSRSIDAAQIANLAVERGAELIIVGQALGEDGEVGPAARKAQRLADAIRQQTEIPVKLWDESGSTVEARAVRRDMGVNRRKRAGHLDELAAVIILQDYIDAHSHGNVE